MILLYDLKTVGQWNNLESTHKREQVTNFTECMSQYHFSVDLRLPYCGMCATAGWFACARELCSAFMDLFLPSSQARQKKYYQRTQVNMSTDVSDRPWVCIVSLCIYQPFNYRVTVTYGLFIQKSIKQHRTTHTSNILISCVFYNWWSVFARRSRVRVLIYCSVNHRSPPNIQAHL